MLVGEWRVPILLLRFPLVAVPGLARFTESVLCCGCLPPMKNDAAVTKSFLRTADFEAVDVY